MECTKISLANAVMTAAEFGLKPNTPLGECHLIPYSNSRTGKKECTFQIGYQGLLDLVRRSGRVRAVYAEWVHANDHFEYVLGLDRTLQHRPYMAGDRGPVIAYYAVAHVTDSNPHFCVMTRDEVLAHGKRFSKAFSKPGGLWQTNIDAMGLKTVLIRLCKYLPKSIDDKLSRAIAVDAVGEQGIPGKALQLDAPISEPELVALLGSPTEQNSDTVAGPDPDPDDTIDAQPDNPELAAVRAELEAVRVAAGAKQADLDAWMLEQGVNWETDSIQKLKMAVAGLRGFYASVIDDRKAKGKPGRQAEITG
jgi:recombination protein RecT